jgi:hypothetical protein
MFYAFFGHQAFFPSAFVFSVVKEKQFWADHHLTPLQTRKKGKKKNFPDNILCRNKWGRNT